MPQVSQKRTKIGRGDTEDLLLTTCLPGWIARSLARSGIHRMSQLVDMKNAELLQLAGIGPRSVEQIRSAIRKFKRNRTHISSAQSKE
ncbi:DNA-directed RNA polymerase subunit alpha C-terminal domain-containing protein [Rhizobium bangladeshense]|uniref:DNA-directed RNA polymerase subunit alpha C-terminal domain-containing protein n=1 Tax=Rhizobium bangladeshense TaxID=1138189 RepID=UPI0012E77915